MPVCPRLFGNKPTAAGFTLVEILIVVVILGILAAIVVSAFGGVTADTRKTAFATDLQTFTQAIQRYQIDTGEWPSDGSSGQMPAELANYVHQSKWEGGAPLGGVWDNEVEDLTVASAMGVHFDGTGETRDDGFMSDLDRMFDDGNLQTGSFRKLGSGRYYRVIAE